MLAAWALAPIVAVLPFRDVAGGPADVGEATRALIAGELQTAGVKVVPRATVDEAVRKVGEDPRRLLKEVGATTLVTGAFAVETERMSLWARFYSPAKLAGTATAT